MNHEQFKEWLHLSFYNELQEDEQVLLEKHLSTCDECRSVREELARFHKVLSVHAPVPVTEEDLREARTELRVAIRMQATRQSWLQSVSDVLSEVLAPQYKLALAGVALVLVGIAIGYVVFRSTSANEPGMFQQASPLSQASLSQSDAQITNLRFASRNEATGQIEFTFDAITPVRVNGNVGDDRVQKLLARALVSEQNPGVRLKAVSAIGDQELQPSDKEVKSALIATLKYDENRGVRKEAMKALEKFMPDTEVTAAFVYVLQHEKNTGMKIAAINSMNLPKYHEYEKDQNLMDVLREKVRSDENNYIRLRAKAALQEVQQ